MSEATMGTSVAGADLQAELDAANARIKSLTDAGANPAPASSSLEARLAALEAAQPEAAPEPEPVPDSYYLHLADGSVVKSGGTMSVYHGLRVINSVPF